MFIKIISNRNNLVLLKLEITTNSRETLSRVKENINIQTIQSYFQNAYGRNVNTIELQQK